MNKKILTIIMLFVLLLIITCTISIIEFYYAKENNRIPILSVESESVSKQYLKHTSLFYVVYECYSGSFFVKAKKDQEPICNRVIKFDNDNNYTNINGLKINKKDYQMIYNISNTFEEIEKFIIQQQVDNSKLLASEYQRNLFLPVITTSINKQIVNIGALKEFVSINEYGDYEWEFQEENPNYLICYKDNLYRAYKNEMCEGEWKSFEYSSEWCTLAKENNLVEIKSIYNKYCSNK